MDTRNECLAEIKEILEMDGDVTSLTRIIQYTQKEKGKSYFEKAIVKDNVPYGVFNDGEEIKIYQIKRPFETIGIQKECSELIANKVNKLIDLRDK